MGGGCSLFVVVCRDLPHALDVFRPDMVVYNAGTDVLLGDPLGALDITPGVGAYFSVSVCTCVCTSVV